MKRMIRASRSDKQYYVVHYGWDEGGPEDGPSIKGDNVVIKARSIDDAEAKVLAKLGSGIEGCWAELATPEDIEAFKADMLEAKSEYQSLVNAGLIDPEFEAQMAEALEADRFKKMTLPQLKKYFVNFVEGDEFQTFKDWYEFLKNSDNR